MPGRTTARRLLNRLLLAVAMLHPAGTARAEEPAGANAPLSLDSGLPASLLLDFPGCTDDEAWAAARAARREEAVRAYIKAFPEGCHLAEAVALLKPRPVRTKPPVVRKPTKPAVVAPAAKTPAPQAPAKRVVRGY